MATVHTDSMLDSIPAWKRELIRRKRSKSHGALPENGSGGASPPIHHLIPRQQMLSCSVQGGAQLASRHEVNQSSLPSEWSDTRASSDAKPSNDIYGKSKILTSAMKAPSAMHQKMRLQDSPKHSWTEDEEELEYGPGIVSRLKNRYLTIAMRESKGRPSLRKYSSLEDLLDDEGPAWHERGRPVQKVRPSQGGSPLRREAMKRTRSMDSLALRRNESQEKFPKSASSGGLRRANLDALGNEDMIIIETTKPSELKNGDKNPKLPMPTVFENPKKGSVLKEDQEMPVPDIVKQVKQIFEPASARTARGTAAKVAAYKAAQARKNGTVPPPKPQVPANKPSLQAKPMNRKKSVEDLKPVLSKVSRHTPKTTLSVKPMPPVNKVGILSPPVSKVGILPPPENKVGILPPPTNKVGILPPPAGSGLTPITASVTAPYVNGFKKVSSSAISNIRNQSQHQEFDFTAKDSEVTSPRPHSPATTLPSSPTLSPRIQAPSKENQRVLQENKKNVEKSKPFQEVQPNNSKLVTSPIEAKKPFASTLPSKSPSTAKGIRASPLNSPVEEKLIVIMERTPLVVVESVKSVPTPLESKDKTSSVAQVVKAVESSSPVGGGTTTKPSKSKDNKWPQQDNTSLVFNFSKRADTPDYIENDGVDLSKRQFPSHDAGYVIMPGYDGKNDSSTDDFDEDYIDSRGVGGIPPPCNVVFEGEAVIINGRSNLQRQPRTKKLEISFDMISTKIFEYPSESSLMENFLIDDLQSNSSSGGLASYTPSKLPLSNSFELGVSRSAHPPTPPKEKMPPMDDYLRPADENETITWSAESAPDMLF